MDMFLAVGTHHSFDIQCFFHIMWLLPKNHGLIS